MITIGVNIGNLWYPVEVYVDSGSAYTLLHAQIAEGIKFEYRMGNCQYLQVGDGSFIPVFLHDLQIQLGRELITASVGFSDKLGIGFNLLGRAGIFDRYRICFQENKRILSFES